MISFYTRDGKMLDLNDIRPADISIDEIANALANQGRYNGQTKEFYSVAQHSVLLCQYAHEKRMPIETQMAFLLHDASEAYCGDIVYHLKQPLTQFKELEEKIIATIFDRFGINSDAVMDVVHHLDRSICIDEMSQLMTRVDPVLIESMAQGGYTKLNITINAVPPATARALFLREATRLGLI